MKLANATFLGLVLAAGACTGSAQTQGLILSYIINPSGNQTAISDGQTLTFPPTNVGNTSSATLVVSNRGTASASLNSVAASGADFSLSGLPLLPATIPAQTDVRFAIMFEPAAAGSSSGTLTVGQGSGSTRVLLAGQALSAVLSYEFTSGGTSETFSPGQSIAFPETAVGQSATISVSVRNTGNSAAQVGTISATGQGFQIQGAPQLPATIPPQQALVFGIQFTPPDTGTYSGTLRIGEAVFNTSGTGLGSKLTLNVEIGGVTTPIGDAGTIYFPNTVVGTQTRAMVGIGNGGNQPLTVSNISLTGNTFAIGTLPKLPAVLQPGQAATFDVSFSPDGLGQSGGTLQISGRSYPISGSGNPPQALPEVRFGDAPGQAGALQQPSISLHLAEAYPYPLSGQLTLSFTSTSFTDDPAIQFASGGRTVAFTIPAESTDAIFGGAGTKIPFQTGSVTGTITFSPVFLVRSVNITPVPAPAQAVTVAAAAPQVQRVQLGTVGANSFELLVTGYATTREITGIQLQFNPSPGASLQGQVLNIDAGSAFNTWYQSAAARQYGSQFTASISILLNGKVSDLKSVSVNATNSQGTSSPSSLNLQ